MDHFIKGVDLSTMIELEKCGAKYFDEGKEEGVLSILKGYGMDTVRIRIWNDPKSEIGESYGAGGNDVATSLEIGKRATAAGFSVLLDFHYSDFWTDPGKQYKPKAWEGYSVEELTVAVHDFTLATVKEFLEAGVKVSMIQVGNELSNGLLWPEGKVPNYDNIATFVSAGIRACREADASIPVMIHLDNGGNNALYREWFDHYMERGEDFDLIGLSYYPFWHGTLEMLKNNMDDIAVRYGKDLIVAEVSMGFTMEDYASYEQLPADNRKGYATRQALIDKVPYPMTKEGQSLFMKDFMECVSQVADGRGRGFFYWEPAWIPVPGSGWATEASLAYLKEQGPCGNEWANQALFDYEGNVLPALQTIKDF